MSLRAARALAPLAVAVAVATACVPTDADTTDPATPPPATTEAAKPSPTTSVKARGGSLPPEPSARARKAFLAELDRIDPAIIGDKDPDRIVDRGRDQCSSVKARPDDQEYLLQTTQARFTAPERPEGFGPKKAARILKAVRTYICPGW